MEPARVISEQDADRIVGPLLVGNLVARGLYRTTGFVEGE